MQKKYIHVVAITIVKRLKYQFGLIIIKLLKDLIGRSFRSWNLVQLHLQLIKKPEVFFATTCSNNLKLLWALTCFVYCAMFFFVFCEQLPNALDLRYGSVFITGMILLFETVFQNLLLRFIGSNTEKKTNKI